MVKNLPANAGDVRDAGFSSWFGNIPLEEGMATHLNILAWRIPWTEEPGGLQSVVLQGSGSHLLYPFSCQRTFRMLLYLGYRK